MADFSRKAGFRSRSFLKEFLDGKKSISPQGLKQIKAALKLPSEYLRLFEILTFIDIPSLRAKTDSEDKLKKLRDKMRKHILKSAPSVVVPNMKDCFVVYAALGELEVGRSLSGLIRATGVEHSKLLKALEVLIDHDLIIKTQEMYLPKMTQVNFFNLKDERLVNLIHEITEEIQLNCRDLMLSDRNLLFYNCFSMQADREYEFKRRLQTAVLDLIYEFQDDTSENIKEVFLSSF